MHVPQGWAGNAVFFFDVCFFLVIQLIHQHLNLTAEMNRCSGEGEGVKQG